MNLQSQILVALFLTALWSPAEAFWPGISSQQQQRCFPNLTVPDNHAQRWSLSVARRCSLQATATVTNMVFRGSTSRSSMKERRRVTGNTTRGAGEDVRADDAGASVGLLVVPRRRFMQLASIFFAASVTRLSIEPEQAAAETESDASIKGDGMSVMSEGSTTGAKYTVGSDEVGVLFGDGPIGVKLGANPLKASGVCRVYVTEVLPGSQAVRQANLKAGFGVAAVAGTPAEKLEPKEVAELIRVSPRPLEIVFRDPEMLGKRLQAEADRKSEAAKRSRRKAADEMATSASPGPKAGSGELRVAQVGEKPSACGIKTKAGDLIEFRYSARLASDLSVEFDSSDRRGTGLPYAIVLGNGDVLKGLDLSLFDMCIGEQRKIEIPARLAYGLKGSKMFGVPPDDGKGAGDVVFGVELVSINFNINPSDKRDNFYTDDPCDAAAAAAGNASGKCPT